MGDRLESLRQVDLLAVDELRGAYVYSSLYGSREVRARAQGAALCYAFKRFGRQAEFVRALVEAAAEALGCDRIVACPASSTTPSQLQQLFGMTVERTRAVTTRKYNHGNAIDMEDYRQSLRVDTEALRGCARLLVIDDICTTGHSLRAFAQVVQEATRAEVVPFALGISGKLHPSPTGVVVHVVEATESDSADDLFDWEYEGGDEEGDTEPVVELFDRAEVLDVLTAKRVAEVQKRLERSRAVPLDEFEEAVSELIRIGDERRAAVLDTLMADRIRGLMQSGARRIDEGLVEWMRNIDPAEVDAWEGPESASNGPKSGADRKADSISRRTSVPQIPAPLHPDRRERCRRDLVEFGKHYGNVFLDRPPSEIMLGFVRNMQDAILGTGYVHVRWPRGKGKTTWAKIALLWAALYNHRHYMVVVAAIQPLADQIINEIWEALEEDDELLADFPEAAIPVRMIAGKMQRCAGQTYLPDGRLTKIRKSASLLVMPTIEGYECSGVRLAARGIDAKTRGLVNKKRRPDLLFFDDTQSDDTASNPDIIKAYESKISKTYFGLAGHSKSMSAIMTSTTIVARDLSDRYADTSLHPEWRTHTTPLVLQWPKCWKSDNDPWQTYFALRAHDIADGDVKHYARCTEYYLAHRAAMDAGAVVMDEQDGDTIEVSAIQHAMNLYFTLGEDAFQSEYQLDPPRSASIFELQPEQVQAAVNGLTMSIVPEMCDALLLTIDVHRKAGLRWSVVAIGGDRIAAVVAYGQYPANGKPLWQPLTNEAERDAALDRGLHRLCGQFAQVQFKRSDGKLIRVVACGIDGGYMAKTVSRFVAKHSAMFQRLEVMRGVSWMHFAPLRRDGKKRGNVRFADEWAYSAVTETGRYLHFHADFWREVQQRSWVAAPLQTGSLSVYGSKPEAHHQFAQEICGDRLIDKDKTADGKDMWTWTKKGGNHWGDCVTMALALAYWHKLYTLYDTVTYDEGEGMSGQQGIAQQPSMARQLEARQQQPARPRSSGRVRVIDRSVRR